MVDLHPNPNPSPNPHQVVGLFSAVQPNPNPNPDQVVDLFSAVEPWEAGDGDKLTPPADANAWVGKVSERSPRASSGTPAAQQAGCGMPGCVRRRQLFG